MSQPNISSSSKGGAWLFARAGYRRVKHIVRVLRRKDVWRNSEIRCEKTWLGREGGVWCVCPVGLSSSSVVYSLGVGEDISFDCELIHRFGVVVHAFDPTPRCIEWLNEQIVPDKFVFHPYGVADFDGSAEFSPPANPAHVSHTILRRESPCSAVTAQVRRLSTVMESLGHREIDLLKMDIEGAEYPVIADMIASQVSVKQLLVEFHHRWPEIRVEKTKEAIDAVKTAGFRIFNVSPSGEEYSFLLAPI